jgi:hypothetical protein
MPREFGPSVFQYDKKDCWRTWFLEECEKAGMVGITTEQLKYIQAVPYQPGTMVYLEDAPYFLEHKIHHRICGPYQVVATTQMPRDGKSVHVHDNKIVVFKADRPESGPWLNRIRDRVIEGDSFHIKQTASSYDYFPLRFRIKPLNHYKVRLITHELNCTLCSKRYDSDVFSVKKPARKTPRTKLIKGK